MFAQISAVLKEENGWKSFHKKILKKMQKIGKKIVKKCKNRQKKSSKHKNRLNAKNGRFLATREKA